MTPPARPLQYAKNRRARFVDELKEFVRFPSVSSQPNHAADVRRCAEWLAAHLRRIGLDRVSIIPTAGHPVVWAEGPVSFRRPTILIYGHYDVVRFVLRVAHPAV